MLSLLKVFDLTDAKSGQLCQLAGNNLSRLRKIPAERLPQFQWGPCIKKLKVKAATLLKMLSMNVSTNDHRNQHEQGVRHYPEICKANVTLLKIKWVLCRLFIICFVNISVQKIRERETTAVHVLYR